MQNPTNATALAAFRAANEAARIADLAANSWSVLSELRNTNWEGHPQTPLAMAREAEYGDAADAADEALCTYAVQDPIGTTVDSWGQGEASEIADRLACYCERRDAKASTIANYYRKCARAWRRQAKAITAVQQ